jgi:hypothetical protein
MAGNIAAYIFPIVLCCCTQIVMYVFNGLSNTNIGEAGIGNLTKRKAHHSFF